MILERILLNCDSRYETPDCNQCSDCSYGEFCPRNCEKCLDYIHNPGHSQSGAPKRKYDCVHMADVYTCKYAYRYTSEIIYALERCKDLIKINDLKVLSFGCGPCTDLFALDYLHSHKFFSYNSIEYRGVDYSKDVWKWIHRDISEFQSDDCKIEFFYQDACTLIDTIASGSWTPNLIVFQYVFSDIKKHTENKKIDDFISTFAEYYNTKINTNTYIILNDINLGGEYGGGREYFDQLFGQLKGSICRKGRFCDDNAKSAYYPRGYTYGENSDGEFPDNKNIFDISSLKKYHPFDTCASAQMIVKKETIK